MEDNGDQLEGDGLTEEDEAASESDPEDDAILHEKESASPRDNI